MFEGIISQIKEGKRGTVLRGPVGTVELGQEYVSLIPTAKKAVFVDGGNGSVFVSPSVRVEFVRLCAVSYEGKERTGISRKEGVLFLRRQDGKILVEGQGIDFSFSISEEDTELRTGSEIVSLERVAGLCRFLLECSFLLSFEGILVRDGPLLGRNKYEREALSPFLARQSVGVVKSHSVVTETGMGAENVLQQDGQWAYPLGKENGVGVFMTKLGGKHLFRVDANCDISFLCGLCDPVFPGYPYPLVLADRLGRVSEQERKALAMRFKAESGSLGKTLAAMELGSNAHEILDSQ